MRTEGGECIGSGGDDNDYAVLFGMLKQIKEEMGDMHALLSTGRHKKVSGAQKIVDEILFNEKVVPHRALKERTGISDSELSRCLKALEDEGKLLRCVDRSDSRRTICVYQESATDFSEDDELILNLVHGHPDRTYRELEKMSGLGKSAFQAAYYKLLSLGLVNHDEACGRLYAVVTFQGMQKLQGAVC